MVFNFKNVVNTLCYTMAKKNICVNDNAIIKERMEEMEEVVFIDKANDSGESEGNEGVNQSIF